MNDLSFYESIRDQMRTGDILLWHSNSILGALIRWRTGGDENHASMIIRLQEYEGREHRRYHTEAMERGVYPNLLSSRLKEFDGQVWWLPLKDEYNDKRAEIGARITEVWGCPYDYGSLFWQLVGKVSVETRRMFCSEVVDYAMGHSGEAANPHELLSRGYHKDKILILENTVPETYNIPTSTSEV